MSGREDYQERRESRIDRLNSAASKAQVQSNEAVNRSYNLTKNIPLGQPNINGALTGIMNKSHRAMDRAVNLSEKSEYYAEKAEAAERNNVISSDDPKAIEKLESKVAALEKQREEIKASNKEARKNGTDPAPWYTLPYIGKEIKRLNERIAKLKAIDTRPASSDVEFPGGKIVENTEINRIQIVFDGKPDSDVRTILKSWGFRWAPSESAWQRQLNQNGIYAAKQVIAKLKGADTPQE